MRFLGSDYKKKELIISAGEIINSSHILAFKSLGVNKVVVKKKPVIMFISTGNEISEKKNKNSCQREQNDLFSLSPFSQRVRV